VFQRERTALGSLALEEIEGVLLVASWFRRRGEEHLRILKLTADLAMCRPVE
jgi:hypothetical protein